MGISVTNNNSIQYISITVVTIRSLNSSFRIETDLIIECVLWATSYKLYKKKNINSCSSILFSNFFLQFTPPVSEYDAYRLRCNNAKKKTPIYTFHQKKIEVITLIEIIQARIQNKCNLDDC